jgi:hypothetical protein
MIATAVWWDLARSSQTIDTLRDFLREEAVAWFADCPGLRLKFWISDAERGRWGAVLLWESAEAADQPLPGRAAALIGYPPTHTARFDVEAVTEGRHSTPDLAAAGLAFA